MNLSRFFKELSSSYAYEIEDLTYDSGGGNVLKSRVKLKREQFADLLPMTEFDPLMVVPALHGGFRFSERRALDRLVASEPAEFPSWEALAATIEMEQWADKLAQRALQSPGGERFMLIAVGLEYILSVLGATGATGATGAGDAETAAEDDGGGDGEDDEERVDLGEAGEDFLSEQGFERLG